MNYESNLKEINHFQNLSLNNLTSEKFIPINGFEGIYEISNLGRVKSLEREYKNRITPEKILKQSYNDNNKYLRVKLSKEGISKTYKVHQLVAITFLDHKKQGHKIVVHHIDGNKLNNKVSNLRLITGIENTLISLKGKSHYTGVHWNTKLSKWRSCKTIKGKVEYIGYFDKEIEAAKAYYLFGAL